MKQIQVDLGIGAVRQYREENTASNGSRQLTVRNTEVKTDAAELSSKLTEESEVVY